MKKLLLLLVSLFSLAAHASTVNVGYQKTTKNFWCYDGFGQTPVDCRMAGAIKVTPDMYSDYLGGKIKSLRIGWSNPDYSSSCSIFLRQNLADKKNLLEGTGTLVYTPMAGDEYQGEYTVIDFDNDKGMTLTADLGTFYVGFYANEVKANTFVFATSYPANQEGSAYIWGDIEGENYDDKGNEIWNDACEASALCLELVIEGDFDNKVLIADLVTYPTMLKGEPDDGYMTLTNRGTNDITDLTFEYKFGEETLQENVELSTPIEAGSSKNVVVPIYAIGNGKHKISLVKVNDSDNTLCKEVTYQTVAIPVNVAERYTRTSLVEFFETENSYYVPRYYDELLMPGYELFADSLNLVSQHLNDQWMTGDDEETDLMLGMCDNNYGVVTLPAMSVDRSPNIPLYTKRVSHEAPFHDIIYPMFAEYLYKVAIYRPTYASISATCDTKGDKLTVSITGNIAEGIAEKEQLFVTAYLLEDDVYTDSQEQSELEKGEYYHDNLQRVRLTGLWGDPIPVRSGDFSMNFSTDLYPDEWNLAKMRVVAFINRGILGNDKWNRDILNSCSFPLTSADAIHSVHSDAKTSGTGTYDLQGRKIGNVSRHGIYIQNGRKVVK